jgi:Ribbon-helix-helix protein, copG family
LKDRLAEPAGREALFAETSAPKPALSTVDRRRSPVGGGWDATHSRVTFYCPAELLAGIEEEMKKSGRSKSRVIVDALRQHLGL